MQRVSAILLVVVLMAATLVLYRPALSLQLAGDDYQWVQHAHRALHRPALLLADLDTFYRPASTWTLAIDRLLWVRNPLGYHLTNLLLQAVAAALLVLAGRRLGLPTAAAGIAGLMWVASPFTVEPAIAVAIRFENLLLIAWLALVLVWPAQGECWRRGRVAAAAAVLLFAAASKETWVVTPALVLALELWHRRTAVRDALRSTALVAGAVVAYVAAYFLLFPGDKHYFDISLPVLAKLPHQFAAFLWLETLRPAEFHLTAGAVIAVLALASAIALAVRQRDAAGTFGAVLALAPSAPTLLVPYLPTRYTAIPYAGFLLLVAAIGVRAVRGLHWRVRVGAIAGLAAVVALIATAGALFVRAELADAARVSALHARLLGQARAVVGTIPVDRPILMVRAEADNPLLDASLSVQGLGKLYYVRHDDPDGLIDGAALIEWVRPGDVLTFVRGDPLSPAFAGVPGTVLLHEPDRFAPPTATHDLGGLARALTARGQRIRLVTAERLP